SRARSGATARLNSLPARLSSTETVSLFSRGCQSNRTWTPSLSRAASSRVFGSAGLMAPPSRRAWHTRTRSRDLHLAHARGGGAVGDVRGQQPERVLFGCRFDRPPDRVSAGATRRERRLVPKRASMTPERCEDDAAFVRLVAVMKQVTGHEPSLPR